MKMFFLNSYFILYIYKCIKYKCKIIHLNNTNHFRGLGLSLLVLLLKCIYFENGNIHKSKYCKLFCCSVVMASLFLSTQQTHTCYTDIMYIIYFFILILCMQPLDFEEQTEHKLTISVENEEPYFSCEVKAITTDGLWTVITNPSNHPLLILP